LLHTFLSIHAFETFAQNGPGNLRNRWKKIRWRRMLEVKAELKDTAMAAVIDTAE
jgi:hypothetical protein